MDCNPIFRAGAGKARLLFPDGYFPHDNCSGEQDPLHARALLLEAQERVMLLSLELPSLRPFSIVDDMRELAARETGIPADRVWVCMTHNLSAPHVPDAAQSPEKYAMHLNMVRTAILSACRQAVSGLRDARLGIGVGASQINTNRDIWTNAGWWMGIDGDGPVDRTLTVVKLEGLDGAPIAILYHYAIKTSAVESATMADGMRRSTSDVTGRASRAVEEAWGAPALFLMGAAADQVPRRKAHYWTTDPQGNPVEVNLGEQGYDFVEELGSELGRDVCAVAEGIRCTREQSVMRYLHRRWMFRGQQDYSGGKPYRPTNTYEYRPAPDQELQVELLRLGDAAFFGLMPEAPAAVGQKLRELAPQCKPLLVAMVNGGKGYLSDVSAYDRCTFGGIHTSFARGSAEAFLERASALLSLPE